MHGLAIRGASLGYQTSVPEKKKLGGGGGGGANIVLWES